MRKLFLILIIIGNFVCAQNNADIPPYGINIKSSQASDLGRYGNIPVKLATGEIDVSIPLISIPADSKSINISLKYNQGGFIPIKESGIVGYNWVLDIGGVINRKTNAIFDEYMSDSPSTKFHGFLTGVRMNPKNRDCFYDFSCLNIGGLNLGIGSGSTNRYEGEPDIFTFNFMGYTGEFMIGNNGGVVAKSSSGNLSIDISGMESYSGLQRYKNKPSSLIIITDDKGIKYYFGENLDSLEFTTNITDLFHSLGSTPSINNSWYLTKVVFPNNDIIKFEYDKMNLNNTSGVPYASDQLIEKDTYNKRFLRSYYFTNCTSQYSNYNFAFPWSGTTTGALSSGNCGTTYQLQKKVFLKKILFKDYSIMLNYSDQGYKFYPHDFLKNGNELTVSDIILQYKNSLVKTIFFSYDKLGGSFQRMFLKNIKIDNKDYFFNYFKTDNLPNPMTYGTDHWGYWNGEDPAVPVWPSHYLNNETGEYSIVGTEKNSNTNLCDVALLKAIIYPTKGKTEFVYEPHDYSKRLERNLTSQFLLGLYNNNGVAGGARIKEILIKDVQDNLIEKKTYSYKTDLTTNSSSSGILNNWPRYIWGYRQKVQNNNGLYYDTFNMFWSASNINSNSLENSNITYKKVYEIVDGKGYTEYTFSNYEDTPDDFSNLSQYRLIMYANENEASNIYTPYNLVKNSFGGIYANYKGNFRGLLLSEKKYNNNYQIILSKENIYNTEIDNSIHSKWVAINHESGKFYAQNYKYFLNVPQIKKTINKEYLGNQVLQTIKENYYNEIYQNNLLLSTTQYPDNSIDEVSFKYPLEVGQQLLLTNNMVGEILEAKSKKKQNTSDLGKITSMNTIYYPTSLPTNGTGNLILPIKYVMHDIENNNEFTEVTYNQYDNKGNLLQYTTKSGIPTTLIYGYNNTQPIAKIEGAKYDDIKTLQTIIDAVSASNSDIDQTSETTLIGKLDLLRKDNSLSNYQITTYTYDPLIGVTSITPPSGIREIYQYDSANRLEKVVDVNGNILKEYQYNYKQ